MTTTANAMAGKQSAAPAPTPKKKILAHQGARLLTWKSVLVQSLGRELHALHIQQQERAFMATSHGLNYAAGGGVSEMQEVAVIH